MPESKKPKTIKDLAPKKLESKKAEQVKGGGKKVRGGDDDLDELEVERLRGR